jgi:hypothetical protein
VRSAAAGKLGPAKLETLMGTWDSAEHVAKRAQALLGDQVFALVHDALDQGTSAGRTLAWKAGGGRVTQATGPSSSMER